MNIFNAMTDAFSFAENSGHPQHPQEVMYSFPLEHINEASEFLNDELRMIDQPLEGFE